MKLKALVVCLLTIALFVIESCDGSNPAHHSIVPRAVPACAKNGTLGACAPNRAFPPLPKAVAHAAASARSAEITYPDLSNNDPAAGSAMQAIARQHPAVFLKVNQGVGFVDRWFRPQVSSARALGMVTGGYDFVSCYCAAEAYRFDTLLRQAGMTAKSARWMPPTLDIEYGSASRAGVQIMVNIVRRSFGRVNIYTGAWYWTPHLGCWWPHGVSGWLAGYPLAPRTCGMPAGRYTQHQYTDHGFNGAFSSDMSVYCQTSCGGGRAVESWESFARIPATKAPRPSPGEIKRQKHAHLSSLYGQRKALRHVLAAHGCRTKRTKARRCQVWLKHGDAVNAAIRVLHAEGIR